MFRDMRRADRKLTETDAWEVIARGKFGTLSVMGVDGYPYGVPMHYVVIDKTIGAEQQEVLREQKIGASKLDFRVGDIYLEVKTPLQQLQIEIPSHIKTKKVAPFSSTDRMERHVSELASSLQEHQRAIFLTCFLYDNPGFRVIERSTNYERVAAKMEASKAAGVEMWQVNFELTPVSVKLRRYFRATTTN